MEFARWPSSRRDVNGVIVSVVAVTAVTGAIYGLRTVAPVLSLGVLYVFAVLPVAIGWGLVFAVPVSIASMLAFNFFFGRSRPDGVHPISPCFHDRQHDRAFMASVTTSGNRWQRPNHSNKRNPLPWSRRDSPSAWTHALV